MAGWCHLVIVSTYRVTCSSIKISILASACIKIQLQQLIDGFVEYNLLFSGGLVYAVETQKMQWWKLTESSTVGNSKNSHTVCTQNWGRHMFLVKKHYAIWIWISEQINSKAAEVKGRDIWYKALLYLLVPHTLAVFESWSKYTLANTRYDTPHRRQLICWRLIRWEIYQACHNVKIIN